MELGVAAVVLACCLGMTGAHADIGDLVQGAGDAAHVQDTVRSHLPGGGTVSFPGARSIPGQGTPEVYSHEVERHVASVLLVRCGTQGQGTSGLLEDNGFCSQDDMDALASMAMEWAPRTVE